MAEVIKRDYAVETATIASGAATSSAVHGERHAQFGVVMPGTLTSTTTTFTVCDTQDGTFVALYDRSNVPVSMTIAASRAYDLPAELAAWPFWKFVFGSNEGAARTLTVVKKG